MFIYYTADDVESCGYQSVWTKLVAHTGSDLITHISTCKDGTVCSSNTLRTPTHLQPRCQRIREAYCIIVCAIYAERNRREDYLTRDLGSMFAQFYKSHLSPRLVRAYVSSKPAPASIAAISLTRINSFDR
jgi:hypothetical protein